MTSQRTRDRLIQRLYEEGLSSAGAQSHPPHATPSVRRRAGAPCLLKCGAADRTGTISQPFMVARASCCWPTGRWASSRNQDRSGYQTTVLAQLVEQVFSVGVQALQDRARNTS